MTEQCDWGSQPPKPRSPNSPGSCFSHRPCLAAAPQAAPATDLVPVAPGLGVLQVCLWHPCCQRHTKSVIAPGPARAQSRVCYVNCTGAVQGFHTATYHHQRPAQHAPGWHCPEHLALLSAPRGAGRAVTPLLPRAKGT